MKRSVAHPNDMLRIRIADVARIIVDTFGHGNEVGILNFGFLYTAVLAETLSAAGAKIHVWSPVFQGVEGETISNMDFRDWCYQRGYRYRPCLVDLSEARDVGLERRQPSLFRSSMYLVAEDASLNMPWVSIPEELRIIKTEQGWQVAKTKSLRLWQEAHGEWSHLLWSCRALARAYMDHDIIKSLTGGLLPGKKSNRSSDWKIWSEWYDLDPPDEYNYKLALKPLWEQYSGELMLKNAENVSQILTPVGEHLWTPRS